MTLSGGHNDTVMNNVFRNNGAWGILFVPYPDSTRPRTTSPAPGPAASRSRASAASTTR